MIEADKEKMKLTSESIDTELKHIRKLIEEVKMEQSQKEKEKDAEIDYLN